MLRFGYYLRFYHSQFAFIYSAAQTNGLPLHSHTHTQCIFSVSLALMDAPGGVCVRCSCWGFSLPSPTQRFRHFVPFVLLVLLPFIWRVKISLNGIQCEYDEHTNKYIQRRKEQKKATARWWVKVAHRRSALFQNKEPPI